MAAVAAAANGVGQSNLPRVSARSVRAGRSGDYFEIKPENMFEMVRPD